MRSRFAILLALFAVFTLVHADVYRTRDANGNVIYSDQPSPGAERVEIREPTIVPGGAPTSTADPDDEESEPTTPGIETAYSKVEVTDPADQESMRDNNGNVAVTVSLTPALQIEFGHKVQLLVDGVPNGAREAGVNFMLTGLDRGAHALQAVVYNKSGQELARSRSSTFFLHKYSISKPSATPKPKPQAK